MKGIVNLCVVCLWVLIMLPKPSLHAYEFPAYRGVDLNITGNMSGTYSNNITFAQGNDEKIDQFTAMLLLGLGARYDGKRRMLRFDGQFRQPLYNSSNIGNSSEYLTLDVKNELSKFDTVRLLNTYTHTKVSGSFEGIFVDEECRKLFIEFGIEAVRNDPKCSVFENEFGIEQGKFDAHRNNFSFNYRKYFSDKINIDAGYRNAIYNTSNETSNDSLRNSVQSRANYKISHATTFFLFYEFSDTSYDKGDNISTNSVRAGLKQYITKRLYFSGDMGMVFTPSTNSTSIDALLTGELDEKTSASIDFSRDIRTAVDREDTFKSWRINGRINRTFSEDLSSTFSVFYGEGDFITAGFTDKLMGGSCLLSYNFWEHKRGARISGTSGYVYSTLDSTAANRGYDRSSLNLGLTAAF